MGTVFFGFGLYGRVDEVPGKCYVATYFFYISGLPLVPLKSYAIIAGTEKTSGLTMIGKHPPPVGVRIPLCFKSIVVTWLRGLLWVVLGPSLGFTCLVGLVTLLGMPANWPLLFYPGIVAAISGVLLWLTYRLTRAGPQRADYLLTILQKASELREVNTAWKAI